MAAALIIYSIWSLFHYLSPCLFFYLSAADAGAGLGLVLGTTLAEEKCNVRTQNVFQTIDP